MEFSTLTSVSLIAAFLAGMVALFAPCCITFLLPAYLGSVFKERKRVLLMTLVFGAGIFVVLMPAVLGISLISKFVQSAVNPALMRDAILGARSLPTAVAPQWVILGVAMLRRLYREQIEAVQAGRNPVGTWFDTDTAVRKTGAGNYFVPGAPESGA